jgi:hypothetical protein
MLRILDWHGRQGRRPTVFHQNAARSGLAWPPRMAAHGTSPECCAFWIGMAAKDGGPQYFTRMLRILDRHGRQGWRPTVLHQNAQHSGSAWMPLIPGLS